MVRECRFEPDFGGVVVEVLGFGGVKAKEGSDDGPKADLSLVDAVGLGGGRGEGRKVVVAPGVDVEVVGKGGGI